MLSFTIFPLISLTNTCSHKLWAIIHSTFIEHFLYTIHQAINTMYVTKREVSNYLSLWVYCRIKEI